MADVALITGASSGLGAEFARLFAADHCDLMLVARRRDRLEGLAAELAAAHGVAAQPICADLSEPEGVAPARPGQQGGDRAPAYGAALGRAPRQQRELLALLTTLNETDEGRDVCTSVPAPAREDGA